MQEKYESSDKPLNKYFFYSWFFILMIVAVFVRINGATHYALNPDEKLRYYIEKAADINQVLEFAFYEQMHPPLGNIIFHYWIQINDDPNFVRSLSLIFGLLLIPLYYRIGKYTHSELAGVIAATIATFSDVLIKQSFLVWDYTLFALFLSISFYYYLRFRKEKNNSFLVKYTIFAILACFVHFSAIFTVFCIAVSHAVESYLGKNPIQKQIEWLIPNLLIAAIATTLLIIWHDPSEQLRTQLFAIHYMIDPGFEHDDSYIFFTRFTQIAIYYWTAQLRLLPFDIFYKNISLLSPVLFIYTAKRNRNLSYILYLSIFAILLGNSLFGLKIYSGSFGRYVVWLLPFVITSACVIVADFCLRVFKHRNIVEIFMILSLAISAVLYSQEQRFSDGGEYTTTNYEFKQINEYISGLSEKDIIFSTKLKLWGISEYSLNPLDYMKPAILFAKKSSPDTINYKSTSFLYDGYFWEFMTSNTFINFFKDADRKHLLDNKDNIVFIQNGWPSEQIKELMNCNTLDKKLVFFSHANTNANLVAMEVNKTIFYDQVILENGKARKCFRKTRFDAIFD